MSQDGLAYEQYRSDGRQEWAMRIGASDAPPILFVPPLFEEMNRTRALIAGVMRLLAARDLGCWLPDRKGTGESIENLSDVHWDDWRHDVMSAADHVERAAGRAPLIASLRGGCLIDDASAGIGWWPLAPVAGPSLARDMLRPGLAGVEWAGYPPSADLRGRLEAAAPVEPAPLLGPRLASAAGPADAALTGPSPVAPLGTGQFGRARRAWRPISRAWH